MYRLSPEIIFENLYGSAHDIGRRMRKFGQAIAARTHIVHVYIVDKTHTKIYTYSPAEYSSIGVRRRLFFLHLITQSQRLA